MMPWIKRGLLHLWRKPFRTILVALFLALVVGLFTVMATVNRLATQRFAMLEGVLVTTVDVRPLGSLGLGGARSQPLPFALEHEIPEMEPAVRIDAYLIRRQLGVDTTIFTVGVRPGVPLLAVGDPEPMDGRFVAGRTFTAAEADRPVAVVGLDLARAHGIAPPAFDGRATLELHGQSWQVIGLFDGGNGFTNTQAFLPFETLRRAVAATGLSRLVVRAPSARRAWALADTLRTRLAGQADVVTNRQAVLLAQASLAGVAGATRTGAGLFFVAGALVVMGAMILAFRDQQRDIGIEKALGASNRIIACRLLIEALLLTSLGGIGGLGIAWLGLSAYGRSWTSIKFDLVQAPLSLLTLGVILGACLALGSVGSLYPIVRSHRLDPIAILREE